MSEENTSSSSSSSGGRKGSAPALLHVGSLESNSSISPPTVTSSGQTTPVQTVLTQQLVKRLAAQQVQQQQQAVQAPGKSSYLPAKRRRSSFDKKAVMAGQMQPQETKRVGFIGAGNMARAIAEGWINSGEVSPTKLIAMVRNPNSPNTKLMRDLGVAVSSSSSDVIGSCDVIVIAVKPYQVLDVMDNLLKKLKSSQASGGHVPKSLRPLVVSVASSVPLAEIEKRSEISWQIGSSPVTGHLPVIRCLPNISASVQSGITVYTRGRFCNEEDLGTFVSLFSLLGHCEEIEEKLMDGFTSLTGSGIAFMEVVLDAMADGGVMTGIPHSLALRMSAYTMIGAANLVLKKNLHPGQIKSSVASPAGTTICGLAKMESAGVRGAIMEAVKAASDRAAVLKP